MYVAARPDQWRPLDSPIEFVKCIAQKPGVMKLYWHLVRKATMILALEVVLCVAGFRGGL
jgi:hypothetical protein